VKLAERFAKRGVTLERLNLRVPSMEHLRLSAMIDTVRAAIGGERDRAIVWGSSLGGQTAARAAERDPRICALVLLAPAFGLAKRWRQRLGEEHMARWRENGWIEVDDYHTQGTSRVDVGFLDDIEAIDVEPPDVRVPTLILHGTRDEIVPVERSREFARGKSHVRFIELDDGHELVHSLDRIGDEAERFLAPFLGLDPL
jgi:pimeloyl-ACP methyl ester carboxylesterase